MNISRALKEKNRIIRQISELKEKILKYNTYREDSADKAPNVPELIKKHSDLSLQLAVLKGKIAKASAPIAEALASLNTLQSTRSMFNELQTTAVPIAQGNVFAKSDTVVKVILQIDNAAKSDLLRICNESIDKLQDEIDTFNATVQI